MSDAPINVIVPGNHLMPGLLGHRDELLRLVEAAFPDTAIHVRGNEITISGPDAEAVGRLFEELVLLLQQGQPIDRASMGRVIDMVRAAERPSQVLTHEIMRSARGRTVRPKTAGQKRYVDAIRSNVITFGLGPAGTGKSWLAVAMAVQALHDKEVQRIILTRPKRYAGSWPSSMKRYSVLGVTPRRRAASCVLNQMISPLSRGGVCAATTSSAPSRRPMPLGPLTLVRPLTLRFSVTSVTAVSVRGVHPAHVAFRPLS